MLNTPVVIPAEFLTALAESFAQDTFIKLTLGKYRGELAGLKNIYVRKVNIKGKPHLAFTSRFKTRDIVKNYPFEEGAARIAEELNQGFQHCTCFTLQKDLILDLQQGQGFRFRQAAPTSQTPVSDTHDKTKKRLISALDKPYLHALQITDAVGNVYKNAQDKYKQINQFINLLHPMISAISAGSLKQVVDMGSGKGYLTFALYDYLHHVMGSDTAVRGIEFRPDLVALCNEIAASSGFHKLDFVEGSIADYPATGIDMLIALHACDTATDDAICKGILAGAELIVVAPCCHKQIRREMSKVKQQPEIAALTDHGIFMERQAEMVTDALRSLILEYHGYKTKVFEFISDAHTPKNVLVVGTKATISPEHQEEVLKRIHAVKNFYGVNCHYLEKLVGL
ncbi:class I SAM-dependent methyltransferase [Pedobacter antarcticus]|uniref:class I SAM-dependent methyltransferase n=1 Tax=Pedobacter antarcticus TaxID=34086 RepID=UPI00088092D0|nr:SAM-dependent methyltransferase [Pedobacter antarcticus]SDM03931.1 Methyltransferase domain-containing protein [Pedobacter antarcticus]